MKPITIAFVLMICISCASDQSGSSVSPQEIAGMYEGKLPCADCAFIEYTVELDEVLRFMDNMDYAGKSSNAVTASGTYSIGDDGLITLDKPTQGFKYLRKHPEGLLMLDKDGNEITGDLANLYILHKVEPVAYTPQEPAPKQGESAAQDQSNTQAAAAPAEEESEVRMAKANRQLKKWTEGVNFHAYGNEPSWNLDIDFDRGMLFSAMDGLDLSTPMAERAQSDDGEVRQYSAETEGGSIIVELDDSGCTDQMSGEQFDYAVIVQARAGNSENYTTYRGCGEYVADPNLHGMWVIEEFDGERIKHEQFSKGIPQIEIDVRDDVFSGHDGCNQIQGGIKVRNTELIFQSGPTTLMACDDQGKSTAITQALVGTPHVYAFSGDRLVLSTNGNPRLQLKKIQ